MIIYFPLKAMKTHSNIQNLAYNHTIVILKLEYIAVYPWH